MPTNYGKILKDGVNYSHDTAESISYVNTTSGLTAGNVQVAIDEINAKIPTDYVSKANGGTFEKTIYSKGDVRAIAVSGATGRSIVAAGYGTTDASGTGFLIAGNITNSGTEGNSKGVLRLYSSSTGRTDLVPTSTENIKINLPTPTGTTVGTLALNNEFVSKENGGTFSGNIAVNKLDGTTSSVGTSQLVLGNNIASGTTGNSAGRLVIYGQQNRFAELKATNVTGTTRSFEFPNKGGTLALTDDIPTDYVSKASGGTFGGKITINGAGLQTIQGGVSVGGNITASNGASTATAATQCTITIGNSTASGTSGNQQGQLRIYSDNIGYIQLRAAAGTTANRTLYLPNKNGKTLACTDDDISQFNNDKGYITSGGSCSLAYTANVLNNGSFDYCYYSGAENQTAVVSGTSAVRMQISSKLYTAMQGDKNLVIYSNGTAIWSTNTSSKRFKHNIQNMTEDRAKKILDIRPVTFDWNDNQVITTRQNDNAGVIAEEVSQVIPDLVVYEETDEGKYIERRVEYERFTPYLIKMIQIQQEQLDHQAKDIEMLKDEIKALKELIKK